MFDLQVNFWSERRDLNSGPPVPQTGALTGLRYAPNGRTIGVGCRRCNRCGAVPMPGCPSRGEIARFDGGLSAEPHGTLEHQSSKARQIEAVIDGGKQQAEVHRHGALDRFAALLHDEGAQGELLVR